jgi:hypothetical protein
VGGRLNANGAIKGKVPVERQNAFKRLLGAFNAVKGISARKGTMIEIWQHNRLLETVATNAEAYAYVERLTGRSIGLAILKDDIVLKLIDEMDMLMNPDDF